MKKIIEWLKLNLKPMNFFIGMIIGAVIVNKFGWNFLKFWKIEYNSIITKYLKILLGWPSVVLIIFATFSCKFRSAIDYLIRHLWIKYKDFEARTQEEKNLLPNESTTIGKTKKEAKFSKEDVQNIAKSVEDLQKKNTSLKQLAESLRQLALQLVERSEFFEFKYINSYLVPNTRWALLSLYNSGSYDRDYYKLNIFVPTTIIDKFSERLAIFNALLTNGLIEENGSVIKVSEKGIRYLKFTGLIK
ncbi:hypothetical protein COU01_01700 [Candidatus Falkowbacteria bacterium CG10_big_fil_rev_8_21_14_0_10_44_15]|uniref:Uncharacterized protein n=1 Tax=Candidatus Falkowbacteria bacterium CG10_big_fil_rev_8_21_14_0_10_44_15 TaxID=1974569 RepID=A0A2H0V021_9BACT|nr:MAG: hypothetical protein COU01_01700 [Candidatus Falkowbacteria bacterium CG10_big_fil_rev_8_21_14_0_10_44_15]